MKFTVELEDFWMSDDDCIEEELKKYIINGVVSQIEKKLEEKIEKQITASVSAEISRTLEKRINAKVAELIELGEITKNREKISITDHIKKEFDGSSRWSSPYDQVAKIAKKWGDELKMRYDKAFAIHIVDTMKKNGLLKDEAIVKLLENDK